MALKRSLGFTASEVQKMYTNSTGFKKFEWFKLPNGPDGKPLEFWTPPKESARVKFDVLAMTHQFDYSIYWARQKIYNYPCDYWFFRRIQVHNVQNKEYVCKRSFYTYSSGPDAICSTINEKELDSKELTKIYDIYLLRLHPDTENRNYRFVIYIDTIGKFSKTLLSEYDALVSIPEESRTEEDSENILFFDPFEGTRSICARFAETTGMMPDRKSGGVVERKWVACNKIDFFPRPTPLTEHEQDWLAEELKIDECVILPDEATYVSVAKLLDSPNINIPESPTQVSTSAIPSVPKVARTLGSIKREPPKTTPVAEDDPFVTDPDEDYALDVSNKEIVKDTSTDSGSDDEDWL